MVCKLLQLQSRAKYRRGMLHFMSVHIVLGIIACKSHVEDFIGKNLKGFMSVQCLSVPTHPRCACRAGEFIEPERSRASESHRLAPTSPYAPVLRHVFRFGSETLGLSVDVAAFGASPWRSVKFILPPSTSGRRMRSDGGLKRVLVEEETQKKRSRTIQESASVLEIAEGNPGNVRRWVSDYMRGFATATRRHFVGTQTLVVASDGKRLGQPAEETTMFVASDFIGSRFAWLMPVVCGTQNKSLRLNCLQQSVLGFCSPFCVSVAFRHHRCRKRNRMKFSNFRRGNFRHHPLNYPSLSVAFSARFPLKGLLHIAIQ
eukprot:6490261-Amphidinium_carterae.1